VEPSISEPSAAEPPKAELSADAASPPTVLLRKGVLPGSAQAPVLAPSTPIQSIQASSGSVDFDFERPSSDEPLTPFERAEEMRRRDVMPGGREVLENAAQVKREKFERMPMMIALAAGGALLFWIATTVFIRLATAGYSPPLPARQHKIDFSAFEDDKQAPN
jgi:hypothetical protein